MFRYLIIPVVAIVVCGFIEGCKKDLHLDQTSFTQEWLDIVQKEANISLPTGSVGINLYVKRTSLDPSFLARIKIPATERVGFREQIQMLPNVDGGIATYHPLPVWWNPQGNSDCLERVYGQNGNGVYVSLCEEGDGSVMLYVMWVQI